MKQKLPLPILLATLVRQVILIVLFAVFVNAVYSYIDSFSFFLNPSTYRTATTIAFAALAVLAALEVTLALVFSLKGKRNASPTEFYKPIKHQHYRSLVSSAVWTVLLLIVSSLMVEDICGNWYNFLISSFIASVYTAGRSALIVFHVVRFVSSLLLLLLTHYYAHQAATAAPAAAPAVPATPVTCDENAPVSATE